MKNNHLLLAVLVPAVLLCFSGCGELTTPKTISVKTAANVEVPMGSLDMSKTISDMFTADTITETLRSSLGTSVDIYDYNDGSDKLTYLVHYPIYSIPFDVSEMLSNMNLDSMLESNTDGIGFDKSITIPEINPSIDPVSVDISSIIDSAMTSAKNQLPADNTLTVPEITGTSYSISSLSSAGSSFGSVTVSSSNAEYIQYTDGSALEIKFTRKDSNDFGDDYDMTLKVTLSYKEDGETVVYSQSSATETSVKNGGTISVSLCEDGKKLPSNFTLTFAGTYGGGTTGVTHDYDISYSLSSSTSIAALYGIDPDGSPDTTDDDLTIPELEVSQTVSVGSGISSLLKSATVAENGGAITIKAATPNGWKNVSFDVESFSLTGMGFDVDTDDVSSVTETGYMMDKKVDLSGQTIDTSSGTSVNVTGKFSINCEGADIVLTDVDSVSCDIAFSLTKLSTADVDCSSMTGSIEPIETSISGDVAKYIKELSFGNESGFKHISETEYSTEQGNGFGISCKVINSFDTGSDITGAIESSFFNLTGDDVIGISVPATGDETASEQVWNAYPTVKMSEKTAESDGSYKVDFAVNLPSTMTVKNLVMGNTYRIAISDVKLLCDWDYITTDLSSNTISGDTSMNSFNFSELLGSYLTTGDGSKLEVGSIPVYLYAIKPDTDAAKEIFGTISMDGTLLLNGEDLLNGSALTFADSFEWPDDETTKTIDARTSSGVYTTTDEATKDVLNHLSTTAASASVDLADVLNSDSSTIDISYNFSISGSGGGDLTVYNYQLESLTDSDATEIKLDMAALIPIDFKLTGGMHSANFMTMFTGSGSGDDDDDSSSTTVVDLLNRESPSTYAEYETYANSIEYVKLNYTITNNLVPNLSARIVIDDTHAGDDNYSQLVKTIDFTSGENQTLKFTKDDIAKLLTHYYLPSIILYVGDEDSTDSTTDIYLSRSAMNGETTALSANLKLYMQMDEDTPITIYDSSNASGNESGSGSGSEEGGE